MEMTRHDQSFSLPFLPSMTHAQVQVGAGHTPSPRLPFPVLHRRYVPATHFLYSVTVMPLLPVNYPLLWSSYVPTSPMPTRSAPYRVL